MPERSLNIDYVPLHELKRDPSNPKDHDLQALAESLERFGFVAPMGVNEATGMLLWGHGRLDQLQAWAAAGRPVPPGVRQAEDGTWLVPVVRGVHLPERDGQAYIIADNRLVELGGWNEPALVKTLIALAGDEAAEGLRGTGFDPDDLDRLVAIVGGGTDPFDAGNLPDAPIVPGADTKAYVVAVVFVSFKEDETFQRGLSALTFGERNVQRQESKFAQVDGELYLPRWEAALLPAESPAADEDEDVRPQFLKDQEAERQKERG